MIHQNNKMFYVHIVSWDFLIEVGKSMRQWLKEEHIQFEQKGNNFYIINANRQRTGEVYSLVSERPTIKFKRLGDDSEAEHYISLYR